MVFNFYTPKSVPAPQLSLHQFCGFERSGRDKNAFSFGIEEEFFLSHISSGKMSTLTPDQLFIAAKAATGGRVEREFLQNQIEVATPPLYNHADARVEMLYTRRILSAYAAEYDLAVLACGTLPGARWQQSVQSEKERYDDVMDSLQMIGERNMLCGMHVHVELPDPDRRVEIMRRILPYLPLLLALSTSSPFWHVRPTGLKGYRLAAYDELPRTGIPELFENMQQYQSYVESMINAGVIPNASHLWWAIRPSVKYPTLELRAPDSCTRVEDALAIAALYRVLIRHLYFNTSQNEDMDVVERALIIENKWRAQRYGTKASFVFKKGPKTIGQFLDAVITMTQEDAEIFNCQQEIEHCRSILANGSSADLQISIYEQALKEGSEEDAVRKVVTWISDNTLNR